MQSQSNVQAPRVLVTGATGFVGRSLLAVSSPIQWRAAVRSQSAATCLASDRVQVDNLDGATNWSQALVGVDCVVHLAARVHVMHPSARDLTDFERVNVEGTEQLARASAAAGVRRFVFLSSVKVNGERTTGGAFRADDVPCPQDGYARSKLEAEQRLSAIESASNMAISIIRPPLVYGPGVRANFLRLLSLAHSGVPLPLGSIYNQRSMVNVRNLSDLICTLLCHEKAVRGVFMVADEESVSTAELVRRLASLMGRPTRLFPMPLGALRAFAAVAGKQAELDRLSYSLKVDIEETRRRLDWSPSVSLDSGLSQTVGWYLAERSGRSAA